MVLMATWPMQTSHSHAEENFFFSNNRKSSSLASFVRICILYVIFVLCSSSLRAYSQGLKPLYLTHMLNDRGSFEGGGLLEVYGSGFPDMYEAANGEIGGVEIRIGSIPCPQVYYMSNSNKVRLLSAVLINASDVHMKSSSMIHIVLINNVCVEIGHFE